MGIEIKIEHEGYLIQWDDFGGYFSIGKDGGNVESLFETLRDCEEWIAKQNEGKFKQTPVLCLYMYKEGFFPAHITSVIDDECVWVVDKNKNWHKQNIRNMFLDTDENREKINQIANLWEEIEKINNDIETIMGTLSHPTIAMMIDDEGDSK